MKSLIQKTAAGLSGLVVLAAAVIMAGLGLAMIGSLAVFGMVAFCVAWIAAPFVARAQPLADDAA